MNTSSNNENESRLHVVSAFVVFGISIGIAVIMLLAALVVWLARVLGAAELALIMVGAFFGLLALTLYMTVMRSVVAQVRDRVDTIYEVSRRTKEIYEWLLDKLRLAEVLLSMMNKK